MQRIRKHACAPLALALFAACQGDGPTEPANKPGIAFVAGASVTDTVGATPVQALVIEVRGPDGHLVPGSVVRIDGVPVPQSTPWGPLRYEVGVARLLSSSFGAFVADTTDAQGRVSVLVAMGQVAGPGRVVVSVPALGMQDTARFTIRPGAPTAVRSEPADTSMIIGGTLKLRASVTDRFGNGRDDALTYTVSGAGASVSGGTVTSSAFGRVAVIVRAADRSDTSYVSMVPQGTIAAYSRIAHTGQRVSLYTLDLDGSNLKMVRETVVGGGYFGDMPAAWSADGKRLVYHDNNYNHTKQLYVHDMETGTSKRFLAAADQMEMESWPRRSWDGQWIYFGGGTYNQVSVYRARSDGTGRERISPAGTAYQSEAAPSPDGARVAYTTNGNYYVGTLEVMNVATRQVTKLGISGMSPRWSPTGAEIAYLAQSGSYSTGSGELTGTRPDGTGIRTITASATRFSGPFDYSPDGRYIVATSDRGVLTVVDVQSGVEVPVRVGGVQGTLVAPVWRP